MSKNKGPGFTAFFANAKEPLVNGSRFGFLNAPARSEVGKEFPCMRKHQEEKGVLCKAHNAGAVAASLEKEGRQTVFPFRPYVIIKKPHSQGVFAKSVKK